MRSIQALSLRIGLLTENISPVLIDDQISKAILQFHSNVRSSFIAFPAEQQKAFYEDSEVSSLAEDLKMWEKNEEYSICIAIRDLISEKSVA